MSRRTVTRQRVLDLIRRGLSVREVATLLGISTQAVYQHIDALRAAGELPPKEASS